MNIKCPRCGIAHNCNFCPNCGLPAPMPPNQGYPNQPIIKPKKKIHGCLIAIIIFFAIIFISFIISVIVQMRNVVSESDTTITKSIDSDNHVTKAPSDEEIKGDLLEFDSKSWEQFKSLYIS